MKKISVLALCLSLLLCSCGTAAKPASSSASGADAASVSDLASASGAETTVTPPEGVVPVTWEPSEDHLIIEGDEARELYDSINDGNYPTLEELKANPVVAQIDALSAYYKELYGNTAEIDTPEREQLRKEILDQFLALGSARQVGSDEKHRVQYAYDGDLKKEYQMELVLGLPASGKSTLVTDPDSEEMGAFIMDCDVIKGMFPEYKESHGCGADAVHFEGYTLMKEAIKQFTEGDRKGTNVILPLVSTDFDELMNDVIKPFEDAGYNVRVKFCEAKPNESAARVVMRELAGGQLINSSVAFSFGDAPEKVYQKLAPMTNAKGETYGYDVEEEQDAAA